jgi:hypothetical protein
MAIEGKTQKELFLRKSFKVNWRVEKEKVRTTPFAHLTLVKL